MGLYVNIWDCTSVEDCRCPRSSHAPSLRPTSPSTLSSISNSRNSDDNPSAVVSFQYASEAVANAQKTLQEWDRRWGTDSKFLFKAMYTFLEVGHVKVSVDRARGEIMAMVIKGKEALLHLQSFGFIDTQTMQGGDIAALWTEAYRVMEGLHEQVALARAALVYVDMKKTIA